MISDAITIITSDQKVDSENDTQRPRIDKQITVNSLF